MKTTANYIESFERRTRGLEAISCGLCASCSDCQSAFDVGEKKLQAMIDKGLSDEGGFSRAGCDCCGSSLGQNLYAAHALIDLDGRKVLIHLEVCSDCVMFVANGDLPKQWEN